MKSDDREALAGSKRPVPFHTDCHLSASQSFTAKELIWVDSLSLKTYAKINLSLDVMGTRPDGYHLVRMVMQSVNLHDEMRIRLLPSEPDEAKIVMKCNKYYVPVDARNTAYKAAEIIMNRFPEAFRHRSVRIDLKKNIPVAAGLAGGSSNAAGVIIGLNDYLNLGMDLRELCLTGAEIGADVPFCIMTLASEPRWKLEGGATCALAEGIGDQLTPLKPARMWCVLVKPPLSVSTAEAYRGLDSITDYPHPDTESVLKSLNTGNLQILQRGMGNVLEYYTLTAYPVVDAVKKEMQKYNKELTMMSGSGPTVYSLFPGKKKASLAYSKLCEKLEKEGMSVYLSKTLV